MKIAVIGSGPSGWVATKKLIELGHQVTVIDSGLLERNQSKKQKLDPSLKLTKKLFFGSDLPYRMFPYGPIRTLREVNPISSFAQGGLSLVWGATMLPYTESDTSKWPFEISQLSTSYSEISRLVPITGSVDGLSQIYGNFISRRGILPSSRVVKFLENCKRTPTKSVTIGLSRLAVETGIGENAGCFYCNKCIAGCPANLIWNSREPILEATYLYFRVTKLIEDSSSISVEGVRLDGSSIIEKSFDKVFMACGPIESFTILANSGIVESSAKLMDSATFFFPMLALPRLGRAKNNSFGLAQVFLHMAKTREIPATQFQIYEYSDDLILRAQNAIPFGKLVPESILKVVLKRMMVAIGYLDGNDSPSIQMQLMRDNSVSLKLAEDGNGFLERNRYIKRAIQNFGRFSINNGLLPLKFLTQTAKPGEGVHFGSWLPMGLKSDLLGRPIGARNIHVIDSSVLPSIAPGPITFTVMANALRIVEESLI